MQQPLAYIPSPSQNSIHLGPIPLRGYALMIILGVIVAVWLSERRWTARGGVAGTVVDIAVWAVPFGLVGGRLYHVITDHQLYFGHGRHPIDALKVWNGGLGIWGAVALGALGAYIGARRRGISMRAFADAAAPGVVLAQAIGRWGNWFNQELYGRPSKLPWAVEIDPAHRVATPNIGTYQPTFLYESLWCVGVAILVIWAEKRFRLAYGRTFALYVAAYTVGRAWIEWLRVDPAHHILGLRLNDWTCLVVFLAAAGYLYAYRSRTENPPGAFGTPAEATEATEAGAAAATEPGGERAADVRPDADDGAGDGRPDAPGEPDEARSAADDKAEEAGRAAESDATVGGDAESAAGDDTDAADDADATDGAAASPAADAPAPGDATGTETTPDDATNGTDAPGTGTSGPDASGPDTPNGSAEQRGARPAPDDGEGAEATADPAAGDAGAHAEDVGADAAGEEAAADPGAGAGGETATAAGSGPETAPEADTGRSRRTANGSRRAGDDAAASGGTRTERPAGAGKVGDDRTERAAAAGDPADA